GCTRIQAFFKVVAPLALPGIVATAVFAFVISWNEVFAASVLTVRNRTLTAYLLTVLSNTQAASSNSFGTPRKMPWVTSAAKGSAST
ncbi:ABC transporter permease subunit, partial [Rhizobium ruizarguesonis]